MPVMTSMNVPKMSMSVAIMPTALTMMAVLHATVTLGSKLVHLILIHVPMLMNVLPKLALHQLLAKTQSARSHAHVPMVMLSTVM